MRDTGSISPGYTTKKAFRPKLLGSRQNTAMMTSMNFICFHRTQASLYRRAFIGESPFLGEMAKGSRCGGAQAVLPHRQGDGQEVYCQAHPQGQGGERLQ